MYRVFGKRLFDLALASLTLTIFAIPMSIVALLVLLVLGRPILFRQQRPGLSGNPFTIYKFRTMTGERDSSGNLLSDTDRLTRFGRLLRFTSLDELPELFNVLRGDMSLVGPRPLLMQYLDRYTPEQMRRHEVRPGITGWAQVNGRQDISFSQRFALDVWYVNHLNFGLDCKILLMTVFRTLTMSGIRPGQDMREVDDLGLYRPES
jgi:lipopolysaccharide/colanic/teichoic acid biosynthesis glycosyltransferase